MTKRLPIPNRTPERADDLARFGVKIRQMAEKKGLHLYEYVDVLTASLCSTLLRNELSKDVYFQVFDRYWARVKEQIEAEKCQ